jgi:hypothetical protein
MNVPRLSARSLILPLLLVSGLGFDVQAQETLTLDQLMTAEEQSRTGVDKMSSQEREEMERWITSWTRYVAEYTQKKMGGETDVAYSGVGSGHWISEVSGGGHSILLNDWSEWEISSASRVVVSDWLPTTQVTVIENDPPQGEYGYLLVNRLEDEVALARYKGRR